jgi:hypothetical protein
LGLQRVDLTRSRVRRDQSCAINPSAINPRAINPRAMKALQSLILKVEFKPFHTIRIERL